MNENSQSGNTIKIGVAEEVNTAHKITMSMRSYFSTYHLWSAKESSKQAEIIEIAHSGKPKFDIKHRAHVMNSILSSIAFAEAAINELYQDASDSHHSYISALNEREISLLADYWNMTEVQNKSHISLLDKYQLALRFCDKPVFEKGSNPYQDVQMVVSLRNAIVHYKPESISSDGDHKLSPKLKSKFPDNKLMSGSGNPYFPDKCLGFGCTEWAWKSTQKFVDSFFTRLGIAPNFKRVEL